jgi:putative oxygen-independent coproporphyrinogen III oxidase
MREIPPPEWKDGANWDLGLYIHIPFCVRKCDYCDFLSAPASPEVIQEYFAAMQTEIEAYRGCTGDYTVPTIFIGGGTPSYVEAEYLESIMAAINQSFRIDRKRLEASIEINPGTISREKLKKYREIGINRLSFGLQSANNQELALLGRIHTYEQFEENYYLARELGFRNINIDLISSLPGQTLLSWENTLQKTVALNPEHISAYSLIIEEGTKFYDRYREGLKGFEELPEEETDRLIYHRTKELLQNSGYHRYEISNYAKDTYECRHNSSYWTGTQYLGIGLGASSLLQSARFSNLQQLAQYCAKCREYQRPAALNSNGRIDRSITTDPIGIRVNYEELTLKHEMEEFMFLGLRICAGVSKKEFAKRFGRKMEAVYDKVLKKLTDNDLLEIEDDSVRLTEYGIDISNYVLSEFLLD